MYKRFIGCALCALALGTTIAQQPVMQPPGVKVVTIGDTVPAPGRPQSVGLVLSGGGAKGIAHIGVIKALEQNNIPIDYIAGTSMGSIIGGLYAMGYTPEEMMQLIMSKDFAYWSTGKIDPNEIYFFSRDEPSPAFATIPMTFKKEKKSNNGGVPASLINPLPMNFAFMNLFSAYTAQCKGDFDNLFVPFRCVASDVNAGHKVVHRSGNLGDAIRTSMSFPLVFQPIKVDGTLLYDGGIFDNFPVDVMIEDFAPDILLGVNVSSGKAQDPNSLFSQIENLVMRRQSYAVPPERGIKMYVDVQKFALLDFEAAQAIYDVGYATAMGMMDSICSRVTSRIAPVARETRRAKFKSETPYVRFDSIQVSGGTPRQDKFIRYIFQPAHADTFGLAHARESYYRAISPGRLKDLMPIAVQNPNGLFTLRLEATPRRNLSVGVGGYITSSTNSFLFLSAGYKTLSFSSISSDVKAWIGQSYMAGTLNTAINLPTRIPSRVGILAVAQRTRYNETDKMFFDDRQPSFLVSHEYFGRLEYSFAAGPRARIDVGMGYGHLNNSFYRPDIKPSKFAKRDHTADNLGQLRASFLSSTLDNIMSPTAGSHYSLTAMILTGTERYRAGDHAYQDVSKRPAWWQAEAIARHYFSPSRYFSLGLEGDVMFSTRHLTGNYNADVVDAHAFAPTPAFASVFNRDLRANSFIALGLVPVYKFSSSLSARLNAHAFLPMRSIVRQDIVLGGTETGGDIATAPGTVLTDMRTSRYGGWFTTGRFVGQVDIAYTLPFNATVSAYANYVSAGTRPWAVGITLGAYITAPRFLR